MVSKPKNTKFICLLQFKIKIRLLETNQTKGSWKTMACYDKKEGR